MWWLINRLKKTLAFLRDFSFCIKRQDFAARPSTLTSYCMWAHCVVDVVLLAHLKRCVRFFFPFPYVIQKFAFDLRTAMAAVSECPRCSTLTVLLCLIRPTLYSPRLNALFALHMRDVSQRRHSFHLSAGWWWSGFLAYRRPLAVTHSKPASAWVQVHTLPAVTTSPHLSFVVRAGDCSVMSVVRSETLLRCKPIFLTFKQQFDFSISFIFFSII